ncbi:cyclase family protein [Sorangium sp. So ce426]|uniref:cyclase family protein n=1 Tax=unclassified Sorangium TaxID=2621164 RepID=UPI003F5B1B23
MKPGVMPLRGAIVVTMAVSLVAGAALARGVPMLQSYDPMPGPSPWGPDDEAGASNTQTPDKVLEGKRLIKEGKVYRLGHVYEPGMPTFPGNQGLSVEAGPISVIQQQVTNSEVMHGEFGQMGTEFDALGHFGYIPPGSTDPADALFYNQFTGAEILTEDGLAHLGVEHVKPLVTRGVLLDVKRYANGGQTLAFGQEITLAMVKKTLRAQKMDERDIGVGDVVLIFTGWEENWELGTEGYYTQPGVGLAQPGIGIEVAKWLASKGIACVGSDNFGIEVTPPKPPVAPGVVFPVHHHLLVKSGIFMHEVMVLSELAADLAAELQERPHGHKSPYEFFYVYSPLPLRGASGSPGIPLAIR